MGKYSGLKGTIPEAPTQHEAAVEKAIGEWRGKSRVDLTAELNKVRDRQDAREAENKKDSAVRKALEHLIRVDIRDSGEDSVRVNGYTWTPVGTPYPAISDPAAVVKHFIENDMKDLLVLNTTELAARVANIVKDEALAGQLRVEITTEKDPTTGKDVEKVEVFSSIPGVRVFLKPTLDRRKSSTKGAAAQ